METTIGIGEMKVSGNIRERLVTYSLGTCLGMTIYDPAAKVGGLIHAQLPLSNVNPQKAADSPAMFIDTGVPMLFDKAYALGAQKKRIIVKIAGCNFNENGDTVFKIGERNHIMIRKLLWKNGIFISGEDIGGSLARSMHIEIATGIVTIRSGGAITQI